MSCMPWQTNQDDAVCPRCFHSRDRHVTVVAVEEENDRPLPTAMWKKHIRKPYVEDVGVYVTGLALCQQPRRRNPFQTAVRNASLQTDNTVFKTVHINVSCCLFYPTRRYVNITKSCSFEYIIMVKLS